MEGEYSILFPTFTQNMISDPRLQQSFWGKVFFLNWAGLDITVKYSFVKPIKTRINIFIKNIIENGAYERKPIAHIMEGRSKIGARALIMGISGMLDCANNFHFKYKRRNCDECGVIDDESHRINYCKKYEAYNLYHSHTKYDFSCIFSMNRDALDRTEQVILHLWDITNGKNKMRLMT